jgi:hypothetical protein
MLYSLLLLACGSAPTVSVTYRDHPDAPAPRSLGANLESDFQRPMMGCFVEALKAQEGLNGTVSVSVYGSHGILKQTAEGTAPQALVDCAKTPLTDSKRQRRYGDGPVEVGFVLDVVFGG